MKSIFTICVLALSAQQAQASGSFDRSIDYTENCKGYEVSQDESSLECHEAVAYGIVRSARVGKSTTLPRHVAMKALGAIELGVIADADTSQIYGYTRTLLGSNGRLVGYTQTLGYHNSEMEIKIQLKTRYNLKGELVSAEAE